MTGCCSLSWVVEPTGDLFFCLGILRRFHFLSLGLCDKQLQILHLLFSDVKLQTRFPAAVCGDKSTDICIGFLSSQTSVWSLSK